MPACATESLSKLWTERPKENAVGDSGLGSGSSPQSPSSPVSTSPTTRSPVSTLRRLHSVASSTNSLFGQEVFGARPQPADEEEPASVYVRMLGWYPCFLLRFARAVVFTVVPGAWTQVVLAIPTLWLSAWLWVFWKAARLPLLALQWVLSVATRPASRQKRTVLISGGSTIQALHLARNFCSAGARVIACDLEGHFALTRYSTAVDRYYTLPRPSRDHCQGYVRALCDIVEREGVMYYVPVCATSSAYYDAVAKPHLELLGCSCFCTGVKEVNALDDTLQMLRLCRAAGIATPTFYAVTSKEELASLYESGALLSGRFVLASAKERHKVALPPVWTELKLPHDISEQRPWVAVQDFPSSHYLTCTTVKDSGVVANVTCRLDEANRALVPVESAQIADWLNTFFDKIHFLRPISCHISFRFVVLEGGAGVLPLSSRMGVSVPCICYTDVHPRIVWRPCKHFDPAKSGPVVAESGAYWMNKAVLSTLKNPSISSVSKLIGTVLDKREALFSFWDPIPYCAYYHMQLPLKNVLKFVKKRRDKFARTLAAPMH